MKCLRPARIRNFSKNNNYIRIILDFYFLLYKFGFILLTKPKSILKHANEVWHQYITVSAVLTSEPMHLHDTVLFLLSGEGPTTLPSQKTEECTQTPVQIHHVLYEPLVILEGLSLDALDTPSNIFAFSECFHLGSQQLWSA